MFDPSKLNSADGTWAMSVSLEYLLHAKKEIQNVHELVRTCAQTLRSYCYSRAQGDNSVHIKKAKDFQRNESRKR